MLKKQMTQYIEKLIAEKQAIQSSEIIQLEVFKEEKEYMERHLLTDDLKGKFLVVEKDSISRFGDAYIERGDKETEEVLAEEATSFLDQPISYFKNHINEFMYLESAWFDIIGVDAISFEADSVFGTYDVMLGLKLQKKAEASIKSFLSINLSGEEPNFDLIFSQNDGLWDLNFALNNVSSFKEDWTIREAYGAIYQFLFQLVEAVEEAK